jgi:F-type H+-transporting ATPase subunit gamma
MRNDYIYEPSKEDIVRSMVPLMLRSTFYRMLLDSLASEHGARMTAMQKATDNATELLKDLRLSYNKARQAAITNEIIEIVSGSEALKG